MYGYPIMIEREGEVFVGTLPDWPECNPLGDTIDDLLRDARHAVEEMAIARIEDREALPPPRRGIDGPTVQLPLVTLLKFGLYIGMTEKRWRKADLARAMGVPRKSVDRLLDLNHASRWEQMEAAFDALGMYPEVRLPRLLEDA
ncbi:MAG: type II toxin-antitoxin system HicB family antitoxin [Alphaproteobacteria bacterium]|jgi:antitoxin HicB|nr:type II toxin-antitoxin system HicB family antitoxin [Alphaproteobacteria bacterium]